MPGAIWTKVVFRFTKLYKRLCCRTEAVRCFISVCSQLLHTSSAVFFFIKSYLASELAMRAIILHSVLLSSVVSGVCSHWTMTKCLWQARWHWACPPLRRRLVRTTKHGRRGECSTLATVRRRYVSLFHTWRLVRLTTAYVQWCISRWESCCECQ